MSEVPVYTIIASAKYKRTRKRAKKQGRDMDLLDWGIDQLANDIPLPPNWRDHALKGALRHLRECHIGGAGDWLLLYEKKETMMVLYLICTGGHDDLFE